MKSFVAPERGALRTVLGRAGTLAGILALGGALALPAAGQQPTGLIRSGADAVSVPACSELSGAKEGTNFYPPNGTVTIVVPGEKFAQKFTAIRGTDAALFVAPDPTNGSDKLRLRSGNFDFDTKREYNIVLTGKPDAGDTFDCTFKLFVAMSEEPEPVLRRVVVTILDQPSPNFYTIALKTAKKPSLRFSLQYTSHPTHGDFPSLNQAQNPFTITNAGVVSYDNSKGKDAGTGLYEMHITPSREHTDAAGNKKSLNGRQINLRVRVLPVSDASSLAQPYTVAENNSAYPAAAGQQISVDLPQHTPSGSAGNTSSKIIRIKGADAALFTVPDVERGTARLELKTGSFDYETKKEYTLKLVAEQRKWSGGPDAFERDVVLTVTNVVEKPDVHPDSVAAREEILSTTNGVVHTVRMDPTRDAATGFSLAYVSHPRVSTINDTTLPPADRPFTVNAQGEVSYNDKASHAAVGTHVLRITPSNSAGNGKPLTLTVVVVTKKPAVTVATASKTVWFDQRATFSHTVATKPAGTLFFAPDSFRLVYVEHPSGSTPASSASPFKVTRSGTSATVTYDPANAAAAVAGVHKVKIIPVKDKQDGAAQTLSIKLLDPAKVELTWGRAHAGTTKVGRGGTVDYGNYLKGGGDAEVFFTLTNKHTTPSASFTFEIVGIALGSFGSLVYNTSKHVNGVNYARYEQPRDITLPAGGKLHFRVDIRDVGTNEAGRQKYVGLSTDLEGDHKFSFGVQATRIHFPLAYKKFASPAAPVLHNISRFDFGKVGMDSNSGFGPFTLTNNTDSDLQIRNIQTTGDSDFAIAQRLDAAGKPLVQPFTATTVLRGGKYSFYIAYNPTTADGTKKSATVSIDYTYKVDKRLAHTFIVEATPVAAVPLKVAGPDSQTLADAAASGRVVSRTAPPSGVLADLQFTVYNTSDNKLDLQDVAEVTGSDTREVFAIKTANKLSSKNLTRAGGSGPSATFKISFTPGDKEGSFEATYKIASTISGGAAQTAYLLKLRVTRTLAPLPSHRLTWEKFAGARQTVTEGQEVDLGNVGVGSYGLHGPFVLANTSDTEIVIRNVDVNNPLDEGFIIAQNPGVKPVKPTTRNPGWAPQPLKKDQQTSFYVFYEPEAAGPVKKDTVTIEYTYNNHPRKLVAFNIKATPVAATIPLKAAGPTDLGPAHAVVSNRPLNMAFSYGATSEEREFRVHNTANIGVTLKNPEKVPGSDTHNAFSIAQGFTKKSLTAKGGSDASEGFRIKVEPPAGQPGPFEVKYKIASTATVGGAAMTDYILALRVTREPAPKFTISGPNPGDINSISENTPHPIAAGGTFGNQPEKTLTFTITNTGDTKFKPGTVTLVADTVQPTGVASPGYVFQVKKQPATDALAKNGKATFEILYRVPPTGNAASATFDVVITDAGSIPIVTWKLKLTDTVKKPAVTVNKKGITGSGLTAPHEVNFGSVGAGLKAADQIFTLTNNTEHDLILEPTATATGAANGFSLVADPASSKSTITVNKGKKQDFKLAYTALSTPGETQATLTIKYHRVYATAGDDLFSFTAKATVTVPPLKVAAPGVTGDGVASGTEIPLVFPVGGTSANWVFTVNNTGADAITLQDAVEVTGSDPDNVFKIATNRDGQPVGQFVNKNLAAKGSGDSSEPFTINFTPGSKPGPFVARYRIPATNAADTYILKLKVTRQPDLAFRVVYSNSGAEMRENVDQGFSGDPAYAPDETWTFTIRNMGATPFKPGTVEAKLSRLAAGESGTPGTWRVDSQAPTTPLGNGGTADFTLAYQAPPTRVPRTVATITVPIMRDDTTSYPGVTFSNQPVKIRTFTVNTTASGEDPMIGVKVDGGTNNLTDPHAVDFGPVLVGKTSTKTFVLTNNSPHAVRLVRTSESNGFKLETALRPTETSSATTVSVPSRGTRNFTLSYTAPSTPGAATQTTLDIKYRRSSQTSGGTKVFRFTADATAIAEPVKVAGPENTASSAAQASPYTADLAPVQGNAQKPYAFKIHNVSGSALVLDQPTTKTGVTNSAGFVISDIPNGTQLAGGNARDFTVTFNPRLPGVITNAVSSATWLIPVKSSSGNVLMSYELKVSAWIAGTPPAAELKFNDGSTNQLVSPGGDAVLGPNTGAVTRTFTLKNTGSTNLKLKLDGVSQTSSNAKFSVASNLTGDDLDLSASSSKTFQIKFDPAQGTASTAEQSATFKVEYLKTVGTPPKEVALDLLTFTAKATATVAAPNFVVTVDDGGKDVKHNKVTTLSPVPGNQVDARVTDGDKAYTFTLVKSDSSSPSFKLGALTAKNVSPANSFTLDTTNGVDTNNVLRGKNDSETFKIKFNIPSTGDTASADFDLPILPSGGGDPLTTHTLKLSVPIAKPTVEVRKDGETNTLDNNHVVKFGSVVAGQERTRTFTLRNTSGHALRLERTAAGAAQGFSLVADPATKPAEDTIENGVQMTTVANGESRTFKLSFAPPTDSAAGAKTATLKIRYRRTGSSTGLDLFTFKPTATVIAEPVKVAGPENTASSAAQASPYTVALDPVQGTAPKSYTFKIHNVSILALKLDQPTAKTGVTNAAGFGIAGIADDTSLAGNNARDFTVTFDPEAVGVTTGAVSSATWLIPVKSSSGNVLMSYELKVSAWIAGTPPVAELKFNDGSTNQLVTAGGEAILGPNTDPVTRTFTLKNTGSANLKLKPAGVSQIGTANAKFTVAANLTGDDLDLSQNAAKTFRIAFDPTQGDASTGEETATFKVEYLKTTGTPQGEIPLDLLTFTVKATAASAAKVSVAVKPASGSGRNTPLSANGPVDFGRVVVGTTPIRTLVVSKTSSGSLILKARGGGAANGFALQASGSTGDGNLSALPDGNTQDFVLTYTAPARVGAVPQTTLTIRDNTGAAVFTFTADATLIDPPVKVAGPKNTASSAAQASPYAAELDPVQGDALKRYTFKIHNVSSRALVLDQPTAKTGVMTSAGFTIDGIANDTQLTGGSAREFTVTFNPLAAGVMDGAVSSVTWLIPVKGASGNALMDYELKVSAYIAGTPPAAELKFNDGSANKTVTSVAPAVFGTNPGAVTRTFTLKNTAAGDLKLKADGVSQTGTANVKFSVVSNLSGDLDLSASTDEATTFTIKFDPSQGAPSTAEQSATFKVEYLKTVGTPPKEIALDLLTFTVKATAAVTPPPVFLLQRVVSTNRPVTHGGEVDLGSVVKSGSRKRQFTVRLRGSNPVTLQAGVASKAAGSEPGRDKFSVLPNNPLPSAKQLTTASRDATFWISFNPGGVIHAEAKAAFDIKDNNNNTLFSFTVKAVSTAPVVELTFNKDVPDILVTTGGEADLGSTVKSGDITRVFTVTLSGSGPVTLKAAGVSKAAGSETGRDKFRVEPNLPDPAQSLTTLSPTATFSIVFDPDPAAPAIPEAKAVFEIRDNNNNLLFNFVAKAASTEPKPLTPPVPNIELVYFNKGNSGPTTPVFSGTGSIANLEAPFGATPKDTSFPRTFRLTNNTGADLVFRKTVGGKVVAGGISRASGSNKFQLTVDPFLGNEMSVANGDSADFEITFRPFGEITAEGNTEEAIFDLHYVDTANAKKKAFSFTTKAVSTALSGANAITLAIKGATEAENQVVPASGGTVRLGDVPLFNTESKTLIVTNVSGAAMKLKVAGAAGVGGANGFSLQAIDSGGNPVSGDSDGNITLNDDDTQDFRLSFTLPNTSGDAVPDAVPGKKTATLTIKYSAGGDVRSFTAEASVTHPIKVAGPDDLTAASARESLAVADMGRIAPTASKKTYTFKIHNTAGIGLKVGTIGLKNAVPGLTLAPPPANSALGTTPSGALDLGISFNPAAAGVKPGTLDHTITIPVNVGTAATADAASSWNYQLPIRLEITDVAASPLKVSGPSGSTESDKADSRSKLALQVPSTASSPHALTFTVSNPLTTPLTVAGIKKKTGGHAALTLAAGTPASTALGAKGGGSDSMTFTVNFAVPASGDGPFEASFTIPATATGKIWADYTLTVSVTVTRPVKPPLPAGTSRIKVAGPANPGFADAQDSGGDGFTFNANAGDPASEKTFTIYSAGTAKVWVGPVRETSDPGKVFALKRQLTGNILKAETPEHNEKTTFVLTFTPGAAGTHRATFEIPVYRVVTSPDGTETRGDALPTSPWRLELEATVKAPPLVAVKPVSSSGNPVDSFTVDENVPAGTKISEAFTATRDGKAVTPISFTLSGTGAQYFTVDKATNTIVRSAVKIVPPRAYKLQIAATSGGDTSKPLDITVTVVDKVRPKVTTKGNIHLGVKAPFTLATDTHATGFTFVRGKPWLMVDAKGTLSVKVGNVSPADWEKKYDVRIRAKDAVGAGDPADITIVLGANPEHGLTVQVAVLPTPPAPEKTFGFTVSATGSDAPANVFGKSGKLLKRSVKSSSAKPGSLRIPRPSRLNGKALPLRVALDTLPAGFKVTKITCDAPAKADNTDLSKGSFSVSLDMAAVTCTVSVLGADTTAETIRLTEAAIDRLLDRRVDLLVGDTLNVPARFRGSGGNPGPAGIGFSATDTRNMSFSLETSLAQLRNHAQRDAAHRAATNAGKLGLEVPFQTAREKAMQEPRYDIWGKVRYTTFSDKVSSGGKSVDYTGTALIASFGGDVQIMDDVLVGLMGRLDRIEGKLDGPGGDADGTGWMIGPYAAARFGPDRNLFAEAQGLWGQSNNKVNPLGTYKDSFRTSRWQVSGKLSGNFDLGPVRLVPAAGVSWFNETQKAYTDRNGNRIGSRDISIGRLQFGPGIARNFDLGEASLTVTGGIDGIWNFAQPKKRHALSDKAGAAFRGQGKLGLDLTLSSGAAVGLTGRYDGIGTKNSKAWGGEIKIRIPLN